MNNSNRIRVERYESRMKDCLNNFLAHEVYDDRLQGATITYAKLSNDMSIIKLFIDSLDRERLDSLVKNLNKAKGLFRTQLAHEFDLRRAPEVLFVKDEIFDKVNEVESIFDELNLGKKDKE